MALDLDLRLGTVWIVMPMRMDGMLWPSTCILGLCSFVLPRNRGSGQLNLPNSVSQVRDRLRAAP